MQRKGVIEAKALRQTRNGTRISIAGAVVNRQRLATSSGVVFMTLEDEPGAANVVIWSSLFERQRLEVMRGRLLVCTGRLQIEGEVIHVIANRFTPLKDFVSVEDDLPDDRMTNAQYIVKHFDVRSRDFH